MELWQAFESLDLRDGRVLDKEEAKKEREKKAIAIKAKGCQKITDIFKKKGGRNPKINREI